jgi:hypothetical protein
MNEQIRQLAEQARFKDHWSVDECRYLTNFIDQEKFAQLIVAECCVALHPMLRDMISRTQGVDMIVKHFGVEP